MDHGIAIYYATIHAEIIREYAKEHPEGTMHGEIPRSRHAYHVMIALFDAQDLQRMIDADVRAVVAEAGFAEEQKKLEKFTVTDAVTYGNCFEMWPKSMYRIRILERLRTRLTSNFSSSMTDKQSREVKST